MKRQMGVLLQGANEYWHAFDGLPADGEYTFTVTNNKGKTAECYFYLTVGQTIPLRDSSKFRASGADPLTPTLSWSTIRGYEGNLFYRAKIYDAAGSKLSTAPQKCVSKFDA